MCGQLALLIDSNHRRRTHIAHRLNSLGLVLRFASTPQTASKMAKGHCYHLILMYFDTIGNEIFKFCSFIRTGSFHTILIALMAKTKIQTEERLFYCGVNDVVVGRQIAARVLAKRIRSHLLHCSMLWWPYANTIRLKDTLVDFGRGEVWCNGTVRQLRGILPNLLKYFLDNPNRIISREELHGSCIWADSICSSAKDGGKTFDVNIGKLRKIIEPDPTKPQIIISVRGEGWKLASECIVRTG